MWQSFSHPWLQAGACDWAYQISVHRTSDKVIRFVARPISDTKVPDTLFSLRHARTVHDQDYYSILGLAYNDVPQPIYYVATISSSSGIQLQPNFTSLGQDMMACRLELLEFHRRQDGQPPVESESATHPETAELVQRMRSMDHMIANLQDQVNKLSANHTTQQQQKRLDDEIARQKAEHFQREKQEHHEQQHERDAHIRRLQQQVAQQQAQQQQQQQRDQGQLEQLAQTQRAQAQQMAQRTQAAVQQGQATPQQAAALQQQLQQQQQQSRLQLEEQVRRHQEEIRRERERSQQEMAAIRAQAAQQQQERKQRAAAFQRDLNTYHQAMVSKMAEQQERQQRTAASQRASPESKESPKAKKESRADPTTSEVETRPRKPTSGKTSRTTSQTSAKPSAPEKVAMDSYQRTQLATILDKVQHRQRLVREFMNTLQEDRTKQQTMERHLQETDRYVQELKEYV